MELLDAFDQQRMQGAAADLAQQWVRVPTMTLAERLVAIQAEYDSACAEAACLKRLAASKAHLAPGGGSAGDDPVSWEIARLRERADAISERASELRMQISEMENHLLETGETPDDGVAKQFRDLRERLALLCRRENAKPAADELKQLREDYLRTRAEELARTYLGLAHQLLETATQIKALEGVAEQEGAALPLRLDKLKIPLPTLLNAGWETEAGSLRVDEQRLLETQGTLKAQLSALLNC